VGLDDPAHAPKTLGFNKPASYVETLHLARKSSPAAMRRLIRGLDDPDPRIAIWCASLVLERAFGRPKEAPPTQEEEEAHLDLRGLSDEELRLLVRLVDSGRLEAPAPIDSEPLQIEGSAQPTSE
jgi:hypothetical protein